MASASLGGGQGLLLGMPACCLPLWGTWDYAVFGKEREQDKESQRGRGVESE